MNMDGLSIARSLDDSTVFVALPRVAWRSLGKCECSHCNGREGFWDTLALAAARPERGKSDTTFMVHRPGGHPFHDRNDRDGVYYTDPETVRVARKPTRDSEILIYEAQAREDAVALNEGRESRLIATIADTFPADSPLASGAPLPARRGRQPSRRGG